MQHKSLKDLLDFSSEGFTKRLLYKSEKTMLFVLNFQPGQVLPQHGHEESDLMIHVLQGSGTVTVNGHATSISTDSVILCSGDEVFSLENTSNEEFSVLASLSPTPKNELYALDVR